MLYGELRVTAVVLDGVIGKGSLEPSSLDALVGQAVLPLFGCFIAASS